MSSIDRPRIITSVTPLEGCRLRLVWSDGTKAEIDLNAIAATRSFSPLRDAAVFAQARVGDWGHSVEWPGGIEIGADALWLETLSASERTDVRQFLEWRMANGLSLSKAAEALGISRRTVAYYSNGERKVPRAIMLACTGWEVSMGLPKAA